MNQRQLLAKVEPGSRVLIEAEVMSHAGILTFVRFLGGQRWWIKSDNALVQVVAAPKTEGGEAT